MDSRRCPSFVIPHHSKHGYQHFYVVLNLAEIHIYQGLRCTRYDDIFSSGTRDFLL